MARAEPAVKHSECNQQVRRNIGNYKLATSSRPARCGDTAAKPRGPIFPAGNAAARRHTDTAGRAQTALSIASKCVCYVCAQVEV